MRTFYWQICLFGFLCFFLPGWAKAETSFQSKLRQEIEKISLRMNKKTELSVLIFDPKTQEKIFASNETKLMTPASILKIIISSAVLEIFGANYRFPTEVFVDKLPRETYAKEGSSVGHIGNLYVRGYGDPALVNETLWARAQAISRLGVKSVQDIVIDDSLFIAPPKATGPQPYQAALSATSLNHNSYAIEIVPTRTSRGASVSLTGAKNFILESTVLTKPGKGRKIELDQRPSSIGFNPEGSSPYVQVIVRGKIGNQAKPAVYYRTVPHPPTYYGWVFQELLEKSGIEVSGQIRVAQVPESSQLLKVFRSKDLGLIVRDLNYYSNNFIAGQLLFALGQDSVGLFRYDLGVEQMTVFLEQLGIPRDSYELFDASGLDKRNRISAAQLMKVMVSSYQNFAIAPDFIASLSRYGWSGTLKNRNLVGESQKALKAAGSGLTRARADSVWGKTGTLNHVSSLAGFAMSADNRRLGFIIIMNGVRSVASAKNVEDKIVKLIIGG